MNRSRRVLIQIWSNLNSSYWFLPSLMCFFSFLLSFLMLYLDSLYGNSIPKSLEFLFVAEAQGARSVLSTIAGSMITVAGVTFSMTLLSVSHASSQIGPRILAGFMQDRGNQVTLGVFVSTFIYSILILKTIQGQGQDQENYNQFLPNLSISVAVVLSFLSIAVLIYFINHVSKAINMTLAVSRIGSQLSKAISKSSSNHEEATDQYQLPKDFEEKKEFLFASDKGYIKHLDHQQLKKVAAENNLLVKVLAGPGDFVCEGSTLVEVYLLKNSKDKINNKESYPQEALTNCFVWGAQKTLQQDIKFCADLLIEIAVRALSPGVNDPQTAIECMDQLKAGLVEMLKKPQLNDGYFNSENKLCLILPMISPPELIDHIFDQLRPHLKQDFIASSHLLQIFAFLKVRATEKKAKEAIVAQAQYLYDACSDSITDKRDTYLLQNLMMRV